MTMQGVYTKLVPIPDGTTTSIATYSEGGALVGAMIPASMAGTSLQLEASFDNGTTFVPVFDSNGVRVSQTISTTARYTLFPQTTMTFGADMLRVVSSVAETGKNIVLVFQKVA